MNIILLLVLFDIFNNCYGANESNQENLNNTVFPFPDYNPTIDLGVVGGHDIDIKEVPYHVAIIYDGNYLCGGSLVRNDVVVTAAHCVNFGLNPNLFQIRVGSNFNYTGGVLINASNVMAHPTYSFSKRDSDIGIIWLSQPVEFSDVIQQIAMAAPGQEVPDGEMVFVSGWGYIQPGGPFANHLQGVSVPIVNHNECNEQYGNKITSTMLCAGFKNGRKDACTYDSGGPLSYNGTLYGIVSWGRSCALPNYPGVYAKVSTLSAWVNSNVGATKTTTEVST